MWTVYALHDQYCMEIFEVTNHNFQAETIICFIYLTFVQAPREEYEGLVPDISDSVVSHILFSLYMIMRKYNACILNLWTINYSTWDKCALGGSLGHEIDPGLL